MRERERERDRVNEQCLRVYVCDAWYSGSILQGQALAREMFPLCRLQDLTGRQAVRVEEREDVLPGLPR